MREFRLKKNARTIKKMQTTKKKKSGKTSRTKASRSKGALRRVKHATLRVFLLKKGTVLFTGTNDFKNEHYFTPNRRLADMYATLSGGRVHRVVTKRGLRLVAKREVVHGLKKGAVQRGEWPGFGSSEGDLPVLKALIRRREDEKSWLHNIDGWIHNWTSETLAEVMIADLGTVIRP